MNARSLLGLVLGLGLGSAACTRDTQLPPEPLRGAASGCTLSLQGKKADGSEAPPGLTATPHVTATVQGCAQAPTDIFLSAGAVDCASPAPLAWRPFSETQTVTLVGPDGANTVSGCVRDAARNVWSITSASITLDTTPPFAPLVELDWGAAYVNAQEVAEVGGHLASVRGSAIGATEWALGTTPSFDSFVPFTDGTPVTFDFGEDGTHTLYAVFRDEVGNTTPVASDSITFDTVPPGVDAPSALAIRTPNGSAYSSSTSVLLSLHAPEDAVRLQVGNAADPAACDAADVGGVNPQPVSAVLNHVLLGGDGPKRVCLRLLDAAGNASDFLSATAILDTTPPSAPVVTTQSQTVDGTQSGPFVVRIAGPVTEEHFARYERLGGDARQWSGVAGPQEPPPEFLFTLEEDAGLEAGVPNELRVRAVDLAGNTSPFYSVVVTKDTNPPDAVGLSPLWVSNADAAGIFHWQPSPSADVVGYKVYYGPSRGTYNGQYASQGPSPISIGREDRFALSGLINGSTTYVTVRPVDHAGNLGPVAGEVRLQPNVVSPSQIANVPLDMWGITRLARQDSTLYVLGYSGGCAYDTTPATTTAVLQSVDLSRLVSPLQGGERVQPAPPPPQATPALTFPDAIPCSPSTQDLQVDSGYLYMASGKLLRIFSLRVPSSPQLVAALDVSTLPGLSAATVHNVQVKGAMAFVSVTPGGVVAIDLGKLFDGNPATVPTLPGDHVGTVTNGPTDGNPYMGLVLSRDALILNRGLSETWRASDALDGDPASVWDNSDRQSNAGASANDMYTNARSVASGNLLYVNGSDEFFVAPLGNVWRGAAFSAQTPLAVVGNDGSEQFDLAGGQAFLTNARLGSLRTVELTDLPNVRDLGNTLPEQGWAGGPVLSYGNYLLVGGGHQLLVFESATPRAVRLLAQTSGGGHRHQVRGGLLYSGGTNGYVIDLHGGLPAPVVASNVAVGCNYDSTLFDDDTQVYAEGSKLRVLNLEDGNDRDPATAFDAADLYDVTLPAGTSATGVKALGNSLLVAERRADGTWLEVYDARDLRDRRVGTSLDATDLRGSLRVTPNVGWAELSVYQGRALVTLDGPGQGVYIVDIRAWLDDDAATKPDASAVQYVAPSGASASPQSAVAQGDFLYFGTRQGLEVVGIREALDEDPATQLPASPARTLLSTVPYASAVAVHGSYAVVVPASGNLTVLDVSSPLSPRVLSSTSFSGASRTCIVDGQWVSQRSMVSVVGTRAYVTVSGGTSLFELE